MVGKSSAFPGVVLRFVAFLRQSSRWWRVSDHPPGILVFLFFFFLQTIRKAKGSFLRKIIVTTTASVETMKMKLAFLSRNLIV